MDNNERTLRSKAQNYIAPFLEVDGKVVHLQKLSNKHHAIMDYMLANPGLPLAAVAEHFHVTQPWLSTVINSDVWRDRYSARRNLMDARLSESITNKLGDLADKSLTHLDAALDDEAISINQKHEIAKTALTALGFLGNVARPPINGQQSAQPAPTVSIAISAVQQANARMQEQGRAFVIDGVAIEQKES